MEAGGFGEDDFFEFASALDEILDAVAVVYGGDFLSDDGTVVEGRGDVVSGGADDFDAAVMGLVVGAGADEGGEEAVVDVDDGDSGLGEEFRGEDAHVTCEEDELDAGIAEDGELALLGGGAVGVGDIVEWDVEFLGEGAGGFVVGDSAGDVSAELASEDAKDDVLEAMRDCGGEDSDAGGVVGAGDADGHLELISDKLVEIVGDFGGVGIGGRCPFDALEEDALGGVAVLVGMEDVAVMGGDPGGGSSDEAWAVWAVEEGDECGGGHGRGVRKKREVSLERNGLAGQI